jgi:hypothetical protein
MYKSSLTDPKWTVAGPDITATQTSTSFVDLSSRKFVQRYYQVGQVR